MVYDWVKAILSRDMGKVPMHRNVLELGCGEMVDMVVGLNTKDERFLSWVPFGDLFQNITFVVDTRIL